ncbi:MAG: DNA mismatch repair protein MutS [Deltaproteobacteria bacterium]|nr:DNA mismatch repair protein MutS [Deltaproteobacteria bacterium]
MSEARATASGVSGRPSDTPLMRQFLEIKEQHSDAILLFRCGDFYEMFFEDAVVASRALDLTLTSRDKGKEDGVPMAGVPYHAVRGYIAKLTEQGHKVAICEQTEDPKLAKGLVKRAVVRIVTPGIVLDDDVLEPKCPRYVAALVPGKDVAGLAYLDATTGELAATELALPHVIDELVRIGPREVLVAPELLGESVKAQQLAGLRARHKAVWNPAPIPSEADARRELGSIVVIEPTGARAGLTHRDLAMRAAGAVVAYARSTQPTGVLPITRLSLYLPGDSVVLDEAAIANLELTETLIGRHKDGSLLSVIDETATAPGGRLIRRWLLYPLVDVAQIRRRQDAVGWLVERPALLETIRRSLSRLGDLERLSGKASLGVATPKDLGRLRDTLAALPELVELVRSGQDKLEPLPQLLDLPACTLPVLGELAARLARALVDDPPALLDQKHGPAIRTGYDPQIDECRRLADGGKEDILAIEEREQKVSGIANLKVRYNRVFGYYIEVTKTHLAKVPAHYIRKQTVATGERYVTPELAELEKKVLECEETLAAREALLIKAEVAAVAALSREISAAGAALAVLDCCGSFGAIAARRDYCRPTVDDSLCLDIVDGRHPVIESLLPSGTFVPNDCKLDPSAEQLVLITGPNMAGKSTYMRQVAQIALLAQIGSFVPAKSATIGICDRVFTRVGAADNLSRGDSTFMVEMRETASILAKATRSSLIILDEVGRGTSTFDGVSIAWAVAEFLHDTVGARTLFATHYHELVALADSRPRVRNVSVAVREHKGEIVFLRRVVSGGASRSYGIDVAKLAGLPRSVTARAHQIMAKLEGGSTLGASPQLSLLPTATVSPAIARLAAVDVNKTTPLEALAILAELKSLS